MRRARHRLRTHPRRRPIDRVRAFVAGAPVFSSPQRPLHVRFRRARRHEPVFGWAQTERGMNVRGHIDPGAEPLGHTCRDWSAAARRGARSRQEAALSTSSTPGDLRSRLASAADMPIVMISSATHSTNEFATLCGVIAWHACDICRNGLRHHVGHMAYRRCRQYGGTPCHFGATKLATAEQEVATLNSMRRLLGRALPRVHAPAPVAKRSGRLVS
jgi:hypothetical protein